MINFQPLDFCHFKLLHQWMNTQYVSRWWGENRDFWSIKDIKDKYRTYVDGYKIMNGERKTIHGFVIYLDYKPVGYIQYYNAYDFPRKEGYKLTGFPESLALIDVYIGEKDYVGKGIGPKFIKQFLEEYVWQDFDACLVDPDKKNDFAIRAYTKVGFQIVKTVGTPEVVCMVILKNP
ncbi:MAG: GNAT family N-acetyltransferase [Alphaproteobacteria bacterium]